MTITIPSRQTLDQRRASAAWSIVMQLKQIPPDKAAEYAGEIRNLPTRILTSGLGHSLAFLRAKARLGTKEEKRHLVQLLDDLADWVLCQRAIPATKPHSLIESIVEGDADFLRRATDETLAFLPWLKRFAEAEGLMKGD